MRRKYISRKKIRNLFFHVIFFCVLGLCVVKFTEEIQALKEAVYYRIHPIAVAGESNAQYTLRPVDVSGDEWFADAPLIYHAGGQIDGNVYTNSLEAVQKTLSEGKNFIELDFRYTSDGHLVCAHAWYDVFPEDYEPTLEEFLAAKIQGKYTPLTAEKVIQLMEENPQMYLVTDTKDADSVEIIGKLVSLAQNDPKILNRFIVQLYTGREKNDMKALYPFEDSQFVFTTYKWGTWQHEVAAICNEENISVIAVPYEEMSDEDAAYMKELGFTVYEFTVDRGDYAKLSLERGISGFYTNGLSEGDLAPQSHPVPQETEATEATEEETEATEATEETKADKTAKDAKKK